jgi:hypothetical protein
MLHENRELLQQKRNYERLAIFCDIASSSSYVKRSFGGTHRLHLQAEKNPNKKPACSRWLGNKPAGQPAEIPFYMV